MSSIPSISTAVPRRRPLAPARGRAILGPLPPTKVNLAMAKPSQKPTSMVYRRFGRTELQMPVLTCGGMRYQQSWQDEPWDKITRESQANVEACIQRALAAGINHIETARGYGSSELQLGRILPALPRQDLIVQTKVGPQETGDEFLKVFDTSMARLRLDHVDLLAFHGVNNREMLDRVLKGGCLQAARKLQADGRARFLGFSTHGPLDVLLDAIASDEFDYINLHWYYMDQVNAPAVEAAYRHDMGVFIISPSDKGGKLYNPPAKLVELCQPFTPMAFNDLFCLARPEVHTLSLGVAKADEFDAHLAILPHLARAAEVIAPILRRLEAEKRRVLGAAWVARWQEGLPRFEQTPGELHLYHILRLWGLAKAFDMVDYGKMRYNLLGNGGHWFPGMKVDKLSAADWKRLPAAVAASPFAARLPAILREAHDLFNAEDRKRLSQSK